MALKGVPDVAAVWIAGLGVLAAVLALLSLITRKNSRHPLLLIGLVSLGILFLSWRILPQTAGERALTISQAFACSFHASPRSEISWIRDGPVTRSTNASAAEVI